MTIAVALAAAAAVTLLTTPLYQASTRLFVSTTSGASAAELYQGNLFSQQRVVSYTQLLMGETLAQRTIDKLGLGIEPGALRQRVKASAKNTSVLIDVKVLDESPVQARDIANALSDEFVVMVRGLETREEGGSPDARVVVEQRASLPEKPVVPRTALNLAIGLAVGLVLGVAIAILRGLLDNTVKERESLEEITGTGVAGNIPFDKDRRKEPAITFETDNSAIAEEFRKLRTNLRFFAVDDPARVIVVASSSPEEGKSVTAINIALALAEAEHNVVLVDGDMRRPMLDKYLDLVGPVGFSSVLSGQASLNEALQKTRYPRLSVLTSGVVPPNPSELLGSLSAQKVLNELRVTFDYVIIDSPPLLAVTDAALLATVSDGVLLVARYGHTKAGHLAQAVGSLTDVGTHLLGAVLTMMPARGKSSYSYAGQYGTTEPARSGSTSAPASWRSARNSAPVRTELIAGPAFRGHRHAERD